MGLMTRIQDWCEDSVREQLERDYLTHLNNEEGSTTVEYAIGAIATAGFAGLLLVVLKSGAVKTALTGIIEQALSL